MYLTLQVLLITIYINFEGFRLLITLSQGGESNNNSSLIEV